MNHTLGRECIFKWALFLFILLCYRGHVGGQGRGKACAVFADRGTGVKEKVCFVNNVPQIFPDSGSLPVKK